MELGLNIRGRGDEGGEGLGWDGRVRTILKLAVISKDRFLGCQGQSPQPPHSHPLSPQKSHVAASEVLLQQAGSSVGGPVGRCGPLNWPSPFFEAQSKPLCPQCRLPAPAPPRAEVSSPRSLLSTPRPAPPLRSSFRVPEAPGAKSRQIPRLLRVGPRDCLRQVNGLRVAVMPGVFSVNREGK